MVDLWMKAFPALPRLFLWVCFFRMRWDPKKEVKKVFSKVVLSFPVYYNS